MKKQASGTAKAQVKPLSSNELAERTIHRRAVEAVIWAMPVVNYDLIYLTPFTNTAEVGPVVLEIPPANEGSITGTIMDAWQCALKYTSPITKFFNVGLGGNGLFERRQQDEFGASYAYTDLSEVLKDNLDLLPLGGRRLLPEHQVELFYNLHITPWLRLSGDLQIIRPNRPIADTAIVPGMRLKIVF